MKRILIFLGFLVGLSVQSQNTVSLTGGSGHPGDTVTVSLALANSDAVSAMQTFIPLGSNLAYVPGSAALTDRSNGHQLTATMRDGSLRIYSYSLALASYTGNSGALLTFRVVLGREPGSTTLTPTQTVLSSATGTALGVGAASGSVSVLAPKVQVAPGSINYGHVPILSSYTQSVTLRNIGNEPLTLVSVGLPDETLAASPTTATIAAGGQQSVTLTYSPVQAGATTMTAVFHTNAKVGDSVLTINADPYAVNELRPLNVSGYTDSVVTVELRLNNMDSIVGLQTSIKLPQALTYVVGSFAADATRAPGHQATAGLQGDTLTMLLTSLTGTPLHGADGVVARFQLRLHGYSSHTLRLLNTALSDSAGRNVLSAVYTGTVSIYSPYLRCNSSMNFGNTPVTETAAATLSIYNSGNAPLVIDRVVFTQEGWHLPDSLPLTVGNYANGVLHVTYDGLAEGTHNAQMLLYTNDPRNDLKRISLTAQRYEPNSLYLAGNTDAPAATPEVDIMLDNYSAVTALQMDVQYPHNHFALEPGDITLSERGDGHIVSAARIDDSTLRVLVLSMQNRPFTGNSGAVARLQLHAYDSLSTDSYPIALSNITSGCTDGVDRLSSIQTVGWFATRVIHDTSYVDVFVYDTIYPDTTYVYVHDTSYVHDTTYVDVYVHDTSYVHDTTYVNVYVHDTSYVHDTTYVDVYVHDTSYVHDTTYVDVYVHDTSYVHDTTYVNVPYPVHDTTIVHDTTYVDVYVHDTSYVHDTTYVNVPYPVHDTTIVHDTTYVDVPYPVHDTTIVHDTTYVDVPYPVHDTTIVTMTDTISIHDTTTVFQTDTLWLHDTVYLHDTIYIHDTIVVGVDEVDAINAKIYTSRGQIVVESGDGMPLGEVHVFDMMGRMTHSSVSLPAASSPSLGEQPRYQFDVPASGTYLVKIGNHPARKVVVIR